MGSGTKFLIFCGICVGVVVCVELSSPSRNYPQTEAALSPQAPALTGLQVRKKYAADLEALYLGEGMDIYVRAEGKDAQVLTIKWAGINRPFIYNTMRKRGVSDSMKKMGFVRIHFTNGVRYWNEIP